MRISDWSSDVCSSDLSARATGHPNLDETDHAAGRLARLSHRIDQRERHLGSRTGGPSLALAILTRSDQPAPNSLYVVAQGSSAVPSARATALDSQFRRSYPDPSERDSFHTTASASPCGFVANAGICVAEPRLTSSSSLTRSEEHTSELQ